MKKKHLHLVAVTVASISILGFSFLAVGDGSDNNKTQEDLRTPITYQGQLSWDGEPVEGVVNLEFRLFNAPIDGEQVGPTLYADELILTNGLFSIELDFDNAITSDNSTWLEITVDGTTLNPREHLASELANQLPYASEPGLPGPRGESGLKGEMGIQGESGATGTAGPMGVPKSSLLQGSKGDKGSIGPKGLQGIQGPPGPPGKDGKDGDYGDPLAGGGCACWQINSNGIHYSGNVGIGAGSSSSSRLYVKGSSTRVIYAYNTAYSGTKFGVYGRSRSTAGRGVFGYASNTSGITYGVYGLNKSTSGRGIYGYANANSGTNYGVYGRTNSPNGYAGYFRGGRNYFEGNVGIGTNNPSQKLDVNGAIELGNTGTSTLGTIRWNGSDFQGYDGTWTSLTGGGMSPWTEGAGGDIYYNGGNVGIGTSVPSRQLDTTGTVRFQGVGSTSSNTRILTVDSDGDLRYRDPGIWTDGGSSGGPLIEFAETGASAVLTTSWNTILAVTITLPVSGKVHIIGNASFIFGSNSGNPSVLGISLTPNGTPTHTQARVNHIDLNNTATIATTTQYVVSLGSGTQTFYLRARRIFDTGGTISATRPQISATFFPN